MQHQGREQDRVTRLPLDSDRLRRIGRADLVRAAARVRKHAELVATGLEPQASRLAVDSGQRHPELEVAFLQAVVPVVLVPRKLRRPLDLGDPLVPADPDVRADDRRLS